MIISTLKKNLMTFLFFYYFLPLLGVFENHFRASQSQDHICLTYFYTFCTYNIVDIQYMLTEWMNKEIGESLIP